VRVLRSHSALARRRAHARHHPAGRERLRRGRAEAPAMVLSRELGLTDEGSRSLFLHQAAVAAYRVSKACARRARSELRLMRWR
jgi:hypothetical protein